ncbi:MAG: hypothetical protein IKO75_03830 [Bacteroidales bacterium]|nr:hypothetical protein [Bacteroidales bacterium]
MKELIEPIESDTPLAKAFNRVMAKIQLLRIMSIPRVFRDSKDEMAAFRMQNYYETVLWEKWLHGVLGRLEEWSKTINAYFDEFNGSWKYYALSKRLDFIREFGSDVEEDYNSDGSIKTQSITREQLKYHTLFSDLYHDSVDIVQDTEPSDLYSLMSALNANSCMSIIDVLQQLSCKGIRSYIVDKNGNIRLATEDDRTQMRISELAEAIDLGQLVFAVAQLMETLTSEIESIYKSDRAFEDNHDILNDMLCDTTAILQLKLDETRFFKQSATGSACTRSP